MSLHLEEHASRMQRQAAKHFAKWEALTPSQKKSRSGQKLFQYAGDAYREARQTLWHLIHYRKDQDQ